MSQSKINGKTKRIYCLIFVSLLLLFNPNINIVDVLPDCIAYFILYFLLEKAADSAAYFEETRTALLRLGYITLSKIPAFVLVALIRSGNTKDTDIFALVTTVYATLELIFLIPAIKNLFEGLFHLGERSDAASLIRPFKVSKKRSAFPESLRNFTYVFVISKTLLFALPEFLILSSTTDYGATVTPLAKYYTYAVVAAQIIGLFLGIAWVSYARKYIKVIIAEGEFDNALEKMQTDDGRDRYEIRTKVRRIKSALTLLALSSFLTIELAFSNFRNINLLPHFLYGLALIYSMGKIYTHAKHVKHVYCLGAVYVVAAAVAYVFSFRFLNNYSYSDLLSDPDAISAYTPILFSSVIELLALIVFLLACALSLREFVQTNTGIISPNTEKISIHTKQYHNSIMKRFYVMFALGCVVGISKCINVFLNRDVQIVLSRPNGAFHSSYVTSGLAWFGTAVFALSVIYIGYSLYFISTLKEEISMKHDVEL